MNFEELYVDTCTSASLAAARGDIKSLKELIKRKKPTNGQDNKGWRALHYACHGGHIECIKILLRASDVDINAITFERQTALYLTCCSDLEPELKFAVAEILLSAGADPNHENQRQYITILNQAISSCNLSLIKLLISHGANVNEHDDKFGSSLNAAVETQNVDVVELITAQRLQYSTHPYGPVVIAFFHTAVLQRNTELLRLLLQKAHSLKEINHQDIRGRTCLYLACSVGFREGVKLLLNSGADPNIRCLENDLPVMAFTEHLHEEDLESSESLFGYLLRLTNKLELKKPTTCDTSFFHMLADVEKQDLVFDYILEHFPDLYSSTIVAKMDNTIRSQSSSFEIVGTAYLSPLAYWCGFISTNKKYNFFHRMVQIDHHIRATTRNRLTPLIMAVGIELVDPYVIRYLIRNGADVMESIGGSLTLDQLPAAFVMALLSPTSSAIETLMANSVPMDKIFADTASLEITQYICSIQVWQSEYSRNGSHKCINLLRNLICVSKFIPFWPFDMNTLKQRLRPAGEVRNHFEELWQKCMEIKDNPKPLWNLACLTLRKGLWEKGGGIMGMPLCLCIEEFCKKSHLPPKIEQILFLQDVQVDFRPGGEDA